VEVCKYQCFVWLISVFKQSMLPDAATLQRSHPSVEFDLDAELEDNTTPTADTQLGGMHFFVASPNTRRATEHEEEPVVDESLKFALDAAACADQQAARQAILEAMLGSSANADDILEATGSKILNATPFSLSHLQGAQPCMLWDFNSARSAEYMLGVACTWRATEAQNDRRRYRMSHFSHVAAQRVQYQC
jgi:hypothetical protein